MPLFFNPEKKLREAEADLARGLFYEALRTFRSILKRERSNMMIRGQAEMGVQQARRGLMGLQLDEARRLLADGRKVDAAECCRNAIELAGGDVEAREARELLAEIVPDRSHALGARGSTTPVEDGPDTSDREAAGENVRDNVSAPGDEQANGATEYDSTWDAASADIDPEDLFELYLSTVDEERAETLRGFGPEFRTAFLLSQQGKFAEALDAFAGVPEDIAKHPLLRFEVAQAAHGCGRYEDSLKALEDVALPDDLERVRLEMRAVAFQALGVPGKAEEEAHRLLAAAPDDESVALLCARILAGNGKLDPALDIVLAWVDAARPSPEADHLAVNLLLQLGRTDEAIEILESDVKRYFHDSLSLPREARASQSIIGQTTQDVSSPRGPQEPVPFPLWAGRTLLALYLEHEGEQQKISDLVTTLCMYDPESEVEYRQRFEDWLDSAPDEPR